VEEEAVAVPINDSGIVNVSVFIIHSEALRLNDLANVPSDPSRAKQFLFRSLAPCYHRKAPKQKSIEKAYPRSTISAALLSLINILRRSLSATRFVCLFFLRSARGSKFFVTFNRR
jgi:hypothetical protein